MGPPDFALSNSDHLLVLLDFPVDFHLGAGTEGVERLDDLQNSRL
jgi:hypothetical protein